MIIIQVWSDMLERLGESQRSVMEVGMIGLG